jgi:hypothetical protein
VTLVIDGFGVTRFPKSPGKWYACLFADEGKVPHLPAFDGPFALPFDSTKTISFAVLNDENLKVRIHVDEDPNLVCDEPKLGTPVKRRTPHEYDQVDFIVTLAGTRKRKIITHTNMEWYFDWHTEPR